MKPLFWPKPAYELDPKDSANNGFINQDFLVWMRRAALPDFRKLYRRITEGDYAQGLPAGNYSLEIAYSILNHITDSGRIMLCGMATYISLSSLFKHGTNLFYFIQGTSLVHKSN